MRIIHNIKNGKFFHKITKLSAAEWIAKRSLEMATSINQTTRDSLRLALKEGFDAGESIPQITERIKGFFDETYKGRATRIARTEVIAASNEGAITGYEEMGVTKLELLAELDVWSDDCGCGDLNGQLFSIGASHGIIPVHPNCRCVWIPVIS